jgi:hypothetical protein
MKWLIRYPRERNGKTIADKLANEIVAAAKGEGGAFKKKKIRTVWLKPTRRSRISKYNHTLSFQYISKILPSGWDLYFFGVFPPFCTSFSCFFSPIIIIRNYSLIYPK